MHFCHGQVVLSAFPAEGVQRRRGFVGTLKSHQVPRTTTRRSASAVLNLRILDHLPALHFRSSIYEKFILLQEAHVFQFCEEQYRFPPGEKSLAFLCEYFD